MASVCVMEETDDLGSHLDIYQNNNKDMLQHETGKLYVVMIAMHTFTAVSDAASLFFSVNTLILFF